MTRDDGTLWQDADRLFDEALSLTPGERARWLDEACRGDPAVRAQVEALLRADEAATRFLELDALHYAAFLGEGPAPGIAAELIAAGHLVGPYRLVRELARGGMGVVYLAERADGQFEQRVALKLIKRGMDSDEIYRRFLAERQILARLNHPHVARLLDGGVSAEGQPYFALEYVEGTTLVAYCVEHRLTIRDRLRLFLDACDAVRYAHQNLVVHRDLKPSNILVTAEGRVKLLDFGIAKLLSETPDAEAGPTETGLRAMTPEYAAPEQVEGAVITTATDVYALGAVLYELLSGERAHRLERRTPSEIVRVVCQVEPAPPSTVAPGEVRKTLRGDLDTIVLTALRKAPARRYATVDRLAADVRRYLDGLPVVARADSWGYRATKFVRRHRVGVAAGTAVVVSLVGGLAGTVWQARVAALNAEAATAEAAKQRAVRDFLVRLFRATEPGEALGRELTAGDLLDRGRRELDTAFVTQPSLRAELIAVVAAVYTSLGAWRQADSLFARAVALTRTLPGNVDAELASRLTEWADNTLNSGTLEQADTLLQEAVERMRRVGMADGRVAWPLRMLARVDTYQGRLDLAKARAREALAIDLHHHGDGSREVAADLNVLGVALLNAREVAGADSAIGASLAIGRRLLKPDHPMLLWSMSDLAEVRAAQGNDQEAERLLREVAAGQHRIYPNGHAEMALTALLLGDLFVRHGRYAEAESTAAEAIAWNRSLLGQEHPHVAMLMHRLADLRRHQGKPPPVMR